MSSSPNTLRQRKTVKEESIGQHGDASAKSATLVAAAAEKEKRTRSILERTIMGLIMGGVFFCIVSTNHIVVSLFVVVLQTIVFKEVIAVRYREAKEKNLWGFRTIHWLLLIATDFYIYGDLLLHMSRRIIAWQTLDYLHRYHLAIAFGVYLIAFTGFVVSLKKDYYKYQISQLAWTIMTLIVFVGQSQFVISNIFHGLIWFMMPACLIICNDVMAYACGMMFGKRFIKRPLTSLSPNKSWEGFVGAFFWTLLFAFMLSWFLSQYQWFICPKEISHEQDVFEVGPNHLNCVRQPIFTYTDYSLPSPFVALLHAIGSSRNSIQLMPIQLHSLVFAFFASFVAPFGGFFASAMKRAYGIKDFGTLFPGHGGMTDRMDCQFLMGFFTFVYYNTLVRLPSTDVAMILYAASQLTAEDQLRVFEQLGKTLGRL